MDIDEVRNLTHSQAVQRLRTIHSRQATLAAKHRLSRADEQEAAELSDEVTALDEHRQDLERRHDIARGGGDGRYRVEAGSIDTDPYADEPTSTTADVGVRASTLPPFATTLKTCLSRIAERCDSSSRCMA